MPTNCNEPCKVPGIQKLLRINYCPQSAHILGEETDKYNYVVNFYKI